jgi:acyl-CoA synthetase (NDP forming)
MVSSNKTPALLETLLNPHSIAIVGASPNPVKQGYRYLQQLLEFHFKGKLYPVNRRGGTILGLEAYPSLNAIPGPVDYVISTIPAEEVPQLIKDCAQKGVRLLQLYTAQLAETGIPEQKKLEEQIVELAQRLGVRLLGPNCMGVYRPEIGLTFRYSPPREAGDIACIAQSAGHAGEMIYRGGLRGLRFSQVISYGNASDINEAELLEYFAYDAKTRIIAAYIEGVRSKQFASVLKAAARRKPVIVCKAGRTAAGARGAASHTSSLAGDYAVWKALVKQCRAIHVDSIDELIDTTVAFAKLPEPKGRNVGIIGSGGGGSILAADEFALNGFQVPLMPKEVLDEVKTFLGDDWMLVKNPLDNSVILPLGWGMDELKRIFATMAAHPTFQVLVGDAGEWYPETPADTPYYEATIGMLLEIRKSTDKPMALVLRPADHTEEWKWQRFLEQQQRCVTEGAAIFPSIARAAKALGNYAIYCLAPRI